MNQPQRETGLQIKPAAAGLEVRRQSESWPAPGRATLVVTSRGKQISLVTEVAWTPFLLDFLLKQIWGNYNRVIWALPHTRCIVSAVVARCSHCAWTLSFVIVKKAKYIKCFEILTGWLLTEGKDSSRGHYLTIIKKNQIWQVVLLVFFIQSCYSLTVHLISDVGLVFNQNPVNHPPSVRR